MRRPPPPRTLILFIRTTKRFPAIFFGTTLRGTQLRTHRSSLIPLFKMAFLLSLVGTNQRTLISSFPSAPRVVLFFASFMPSSLSSPSPPTSTKSVYLPLPLKSPSQITCRSWTLPSWSWASGNVLVRGLATNACMLIKTARGCNYFHHPCVRPAYILTPLYVNPFFFFFFKSLFLKSLRSTKTA